MLLLVCARQLRDDSAKGNPPSEQHGGLRFQRDDDDDAMCTKALADADAEA